MREPGERLLVIDTYGGLGNRVKPVVSGARWAEETGRRLVYRWTRDRLFRALPEHLWVDFPGRSSQLEFLRAKSGSRRCEPWEVGQHRDAERVYVRHHDPLGDPATTETWRSDLRRFTPVPEVRDRAVDVLDRFGARPLRVGVMVRAHRRASDETKLTSPVSWFIERIGAAQKMLGDQASIYLSCDDRATEEQIRARFPGLITTTKHGYNSREGVRDAVVDLYGLGACDLLVGPDGSTFIHLAEYMAGGQAAVITPSVSDADAAIAGLRGSRPRRESYPWLYQSADHSGGSERAQ